MGSFGGFYKGEKKKAKQNSKKGGQQVFTSKPVFVLPKMLEKKKKEE
jgi:hypothetical protein